MNNSDSGPKLVDSAELDRLTAEWLGCLRKCHGLMIALNHATFRRSLDDQSKLLQALRAEEAQCHTFSREVRAYRQALEAKEYNSAGGA